MQNLLTFPEYLKFNLWVTQAEIITALSINKYHSSWWLNGIKPRGWTWYFQGSKDFSRSFEDFQAGGNIQDFFGNYFDEMTPSVKCAFLYKSVKKILLRTTEKINYV